MTWEGIANQYLNCTIKLIERNCAPELVPSLRCALQAVKLAIREAAARERE